MELKLPTSLRVNILHTVLIVPLWNWNLSASNIRAWPLSGFNCTFMELKWSTNVPWKQSKTVLIVPLWNWNNFSASRWCTMRSVLIVPLWNWNNYVLIRCLQGGTGFNCTFMELKFLSKCKEVTDEEVLIVPLWNWNCFMRLMRSHNLAVLIVPLWNWNSLANIG